MISEWLVVDWYTGFLTIQIRNGNAEGFALGFFLCMFGIENAYPCLATGRHFGE